MKNLILALLLLYFLHAQFFTEEKAIEEYTVIWAMNPMVAERIVNSKIKEGWEPLGGVTGRVAGIDGGALYQAMVRYEVFDK